VNAAGLVNRIGNVPPRLGRTIAVSGLLATVLVAALGVSGALDRSQTVALPILPPPGQIWFGISYDPSTYEVYDRTISMSPRNSVALVAALSRVTTRDERLTLYVTISGQNAPIGSRVMGPGQEAMADQTGVASFPGVYRFQVEDQAGDVLASGTLTVTEAPSTPFVLIDGGSAGR